MDLSVALYLGLLLAVGVGRLVEVRISQRRRRRMLAQGAAKVPEKHFRWMVLLHAGILFAAAAEVLLLRRPFLPALALAMGILFVLANVVRWWVMATLGPLWNVQVMNSTRLGVVTSGPFRWVRHPNYAAVFIEMLALPLIHSAWLTAAGGGIAQIWILSQRVKVEEAVLMSDPAYRAAMGEKPRFVPRLFSRAPRRESHPQHTNG